MLRDIVRKYTKYTKNIKTFNCMTNQITYTTRSCDLETNFSILHNTQNDWEKLICKFANQRTLIMIFRIKIQI